MSLMGKLKGIGKKDDSPEVSVKEDKKVMPFTSLFGIKGIMMIVCDFRVL